MATVKRIFNVGYYFRNLIYSQMQENKYSACYHLWLKGEHFQEGYQVIQLLSMHKKNLIEI
jgi:hypothetical protein